MRDPVARWIVNKKRRLAAWFVRDAEGGATRKAYCPKRFYRRRHKIENFFCRIKDWRRIATGYDKLARNFLAATTLVGVLCWTKL